MKKVIFNKNEYNSFKDFYHDLYQKLNGKSTIDFEELNDLGYHADILNEFLWYKAEEKNNYIFLNFDLKKIQNKKTYENYEWNLIFKIFKRHVQEFPNNQIEFRNEDK